MSTKSMQQPSTKAEAPLTVLSKTSSETLIDVSGLQPDDHVLVIGRNLSDHLVGLAHHGCGTATGAQSDSLFIRLEAADVVWFTGVDALKSQVSAALCNIGDPRVVVIELLATADADALRHCLRQLATKGLVHCSYHQMADRLIVTANRPKWLRWVA
jgi:hypothetical protein